MCTLSWTASDNGYHLFFNRDEMRTRARAEPPAVRPAPPAQSLHPIDPQGGGTWISVNQQGLCICLLNNYDSRPARAARRSRGLLVTDLAACAGLGGLRRALDDADLGPYNGFRLCALDAAGDMLCGDWDSRRLRWSRPEICCISSSSLDGPRIVRQRIAMYKERFADGASPDALLAWHSSHEPCRPESVCMHREDGRTQSLTAVRVDAAAVAMGYSDGPPCNAPLQWGPSLPRMAA